MNILEAKGITKVFPGVVALDGVDITIEKGSVHGIVGENGAGKSTLINVLCGALHPEYGSMIFDGEPVSFKSIKDANEKGVSVVFQELSLVPTLSIAENIFANRQPLTAMGTIDWDELWKKGREELDSFGLHDYDPKASVMSLSIASQQLIEILKALSLKPKLLILDEPTSSLTEHETRILFESVRKLKETGCSFIYISHHMNEIFELCDHVTVLRDGKYVCDRAVADIDQQYLISMMVGRNLDDIYGKRKCLQNPSEMAPVLEVSHIGRTGSFYDVSFEVHAGEIVTLAGLIGAGRSEVCRGIFGLEPIDKGTIRLCGKEVAVPNTSKAIEMGIAYMTEDRKTEGLFLNHDIRFNFLSNKINMFSKHGLMQDSDDSLSETLIQDFRIACTGLHQQVSTLSGGNQQKVMLGEWVSIKPKLLIIDEPTRGVDIGAKSEIYKKLRELAEEGIALLIVSSELPEVLNISDRIIVMRSGTIAGEVAAENATEESVLSLAIASINQ